MLALIIRGQRCLFIRQIIGVRWVHGGPEDIDPMLKSREGLPIITVPYYYRGSLKKVRRSIAFEESQIVHRLEKSRASRKHQKDRS